MLSIGEKFPKFKVKATVGIDNRKAARLAALTEAAPVLLAAHTS